MLVYALLQMRSGVNQTALELILRGQGISNGALSHDCFVLATIRNESLHEEAERDAFFANLEKGGLALVLLVEPNADGTAEILYPSSDKESDAEADRAWKQLCKFLATEYGREWQHTQKIWRNRHLLPCA